MSGARAIALLGGSSAFTPALAKRLAVAAPSLPALDVRLCGRRPSITAAVARFCNLVARDAGASHRYVAAADVAEAARGAAVVINQIRVGGWAGRHHDDSFPLPFDLPGDETIGPGGLASAMRSLPAVLELARSVEAVAPEAWFVNMTNPMSTLLAGLRAGSRLRAFGLCELPRVTLARALDHLGVARHEAEVDYLGVNHQGWFVRIRRDGRDRLPALFDALDARPDAFFRVSVPVMRDLGALPLPYMRLYYHRDREVEAMRARTASRGHVLARLSADLHEAYAESTTGAIPPALEARDTSWYDDWVTMLVGLLDTQGGAPRDELYVSEVNDGYLPGLPANAIVEKRAIVGPDGVRAAPFSGPAPVADGVYEPRLVFLRRVIAYEDAAVAAALEPSDEAVIHALRSHPLDIAADTAARLAPLVRQSVEAAPEGDRHADVV